MHGAGNMTPFETQYAARAVRMSAAPAAQRTPAAWRAYAHRRRAWLIADELFCRQRPPSRRAKERAPAHP
jgi:hypothetical protein